MFQRKSLKISGLHSVVVITNLPYESEGFLVIKSLKNNICTGGLRITNEVNLDEVIELAICMDLKFQSYDLEVGGAKSGLRIPLNCTSRMREEILKEFAISLRPELEECYLTGTDLGSTQADVELIYRELNLNQMVLSKKLLKKTMMKSMMFYLPDFILRLIPVGYSKYGGLFTAKGMLLALENYTKINSTSEGERQVVVHGVGEVGRNFLNILTNDKKYKIKAVCDKRIGVVFSSMVSSMKIVNSIGVDGYIDTSKLSKDIDFKIVKAEEILEISSDVLVLVSSSNIINEIEAHHIETRIIVEGANNAIGKKAQEILDSRGIVVLPDFYINSAIACSFGLMVMNKVSPYIEYYFLLKTLRYMDKKMKTIFSMAHEQKKSVRSLLLK